MPGEVLPAANRGRSGLPPLSASIRNEPPPSCADHGRISSNTLKTQPPLPQVAKCVYTPGISASSSSFSVISAPSRASHSHDLLMRTNHELFVLNCQEEQELPASFVEKGRFSLKLVALLNSIRRASRSLRHLTRLRYVKGHRHPPRPARHRHPERASVKSARGQTEKQHGCAATSALVRSPDESLALWQQVLCVHNLV